MSGGSRVQKQYKQNGLGNKAPRKYWGRGFQVGMGKSVSWDPPGNLPRTDVFNWLALQLPTKEIQLLSSAAPSLSTEI